MDSNGSVLSLGDLKVGDAIALDGGFGFGAGQINAYSILRLPGVPESRLEFAPDKLADPIFYMDGRAINTDTSTAYIGLTRTQFFAGQWPGSFHCPARWSVFVRLNADGSLTALSITVTWKVDFCW
jgi:hypothetical protein